METYKNLANTTQGAILMCVNRGKMSEGIGNIINQFKRFHGQVMSSGFYGRNTFFTNIRQKN